LLIFLATPQKFTLLRRFCAQMAGFVPGLHFGGWASLGVFMEEFLASG
jgi:hypothetical protein